MELLQRQLCVAYLSAPLLLLAEVRPINIAMSHPEDPGRNIQVPAYGLEGWTLQ